MASTKTPHLSIIGPVSVFGSPFLAVSGSWKPTLHLPSILATDHRRSVLEPIIAHELLHIRRGDTIWGIMQFLVQVIWWFHPLVWWLNQLANRNCERCCDEETIALLQYQPVRYANCLLFVLEARRRMRPLAMHRSIRAANVTSDRLTKIMTQKSRRRTPLANWAMAILIGTMLLPGASLLHGEDLGAQIHNDDGTHAWQTHDWSRASSEYATIVKNSPNNGRAWFRLGYALHATGQFADAIVAHDRASRFVHYRTFALYNHACALARLGRNSAAIEKLEAAIDAGFYADNGIGWDSDLESIRSHPKVQELSQRAVPPGKREADHQFDFLIGEWTLRDPGGSEIGSAFVTANEGGLAARLSQNNGESETDVAFQNQDETGWTARISRDGLKVEVSGRFVGGMARLSGQSVQATGVKEQLTVCLTPFPTGTICISISRRRRGETEPVVFNGWYQRQSSNAQKK
jgi:tetratricopeptide (TPR) repeat protein